MPVGIEKQAAFEIDRIVQSTLWRENGRKVNSRPYCFTTEQ